MKKSTDDRCIERAVKKTMTILANLCLGYPIQVQIALLLINTPAQSLCGFPIPRPWPKEDNMHTKNIVDCHDEPVLPLAPSRL